MLNCSLGPSPQPCLRPGTTRAKFMQERPCREKKGSECGMEMGRQSGWPPSRPTSQHSGVLPVSSSLKGGYTIIASSNILRRYLGYVDIC